MDLVAVNFSLNFLRDYFDVCVCETVSVHSLLRTSSICAVCYIVLVAYKL